MKASSTTGWMHSQAGDASTWKLIITGHQFASYKPVLVVRLRLQVSWKIFHQKSHVDAKSKRRVEGTVPWSRRPGCGESARQTGKLFNRLWSLHMHILKRKSFRIHFRTARKVCYWKFHVFIRNFRFSARESKTSFSVLFLFCCKCTWNANKK